MSRIKKTKDALGRWAFKNIPGLKERWAKSHRGVAVGDTPFAPLVKPLSECTVALVTTAGVHLADQPPFDMENKDGDASWRELPVDAKDRFVITHDYYDHRDAERDINIVLPVDRLREAERLGVIGRLHPVAFSFMGHIQHDPLTRLLDVTAPEVAGKIAAGQVDVVLLTPA